MQVKTRGARGRKAAKASQFTRGMLIGFNDEGDPLVDFPANATGGPLPAVSTLALLPEFAGRECVLAFEDGDVSRPIVIGLTQPPLKPIEPVAGSRREPVDLVLDKRRVVLNADEEIVLRCGNASITLTRAGKVLIRGAYLLNRSSGVNRIKGGSVQIN